MTIRNNSKDAQNKLAECAAGTACATDEPKGKVQDPASSAVPKVQDVASEVSHKAQDWAANVANKAQETASAAVDKTNGGIAAVGQQLNALGGTLRDAVPPHGAIGSAATKVADQLQVGGRYLEGHGLQDMGTDFTSLVRHYPIPSVLVGFGIGCLLGMTFLRRS